MIRPKDTLPTQAIEELFSNQFSQLHASSNNFSFGDMQENEIKEKWLLPLIRLASEYIKSSNPLYKKIYAGERLFRPFSPHTSNAFKKKYLETTIPKDIEILSKHLGGLEKLIDLHDFIKFPPTSDEIAVTTLGDCIMSQINSITAMLALEKGIGITKHEHAIGAFAEETDFDREIHIRTNRDASANIIAISPFTYWGIPGFRLLMKKLWHSNIEGEEACGLVNLVTEFLEKYVESIQKKTKSIIFLHNSSGLPWLVQNIFLDYFPWNASGMGDYPEMEKFIGKINNAVDKYIEKNKSIFLIDERRIAASHDRTQLYAEILPPNILKNSIFHYNLFGFKMAEYYINLIGQINYIKFIKVLFVDLDNTLWSGNIAEGKVDHHLDKQKIIYDLYVAGILLVALSKNDESNIRWSEITFDYDCFCLLKINWNSKVTNIASAAKELNISIDQAMILDDSPQELGLIQFHFPEIKAVDSSKNSSWEILVALSKYAHSRSSNAFNRTKAYRENIKRKDYFNANAESASFTENLKKIYAPLNITLTTGLASHSNINRIHELLERTSQFNCSGKMFTLAELNENLLASNYNIVVFHMKDSFGDMGLVGCVFIKTHSDWHCIENFILSCRAMGYFAEKCILDYILNRFLDKKVIKAVLNPTPKNIAAQSIYKTFGFVATDEPNILIRPASTQTKAPEVDWIRLIIE